jgi:hypothetical protein
LLFSFKLAATAIRMHATTMLKKSRLLHTMLPTTTTTTIVHETIQNNKNKNTEKGQPQTNL